MVCGEAEDAGGLSPVKDDNEAARHFIRRTLPILGCVDYTIYDYGADDPTGAYRYALVRMRADYEVQALLLEQDTDFGISYVPVFQYEPNSGQVIQADGIMSEGVGSIGGYRGGLVYFKEKQRGMAEKDPPLGHVVHFSNKA